MKVKIISTLAVTGFFALAGTTAFAQSETAAEARAEATQSTTATEQPAEAEEKKRKPPRQATNNVGRQNGSDVICKKTKKKGTRLRQSKICKTRAQWEVERTETRRELDEVKARTSVGQVR